jgi:hypothetical protein
MPVWFCHDTMLMSHILALHHDTMLMSHILALHHYTMLMSHILAFIDGANLTKDVSQQDG